MHTPTGQIYAHMVTEHAVPAVKQLYEDRAVWQDDPVKIQRAEALKVCEVFPARIPPDRQAAKMPDVQPIENVRAIVKQRAKKGCTTPKAELRKVIINNWQEIDQDKDSCKQCGL